MSDIALSSMFSLNQFHMLSVASTAFRSGQGCHGVEHHPQNRSAASMLEIGAHCAAAIHSIPQIKAVVQGDRLLDLLLLEPTLIFRKSYTSTA